MAKAKHSCKAYIRSVISLCFACALIWLTVPAVAQIPAYVGSGVCAECHPAKAERWQGSHHALAWTQPDKKTVEGNFADINFDHNGETVRFFQRGEIFMVSVTGPDHVMRDYEVRGVVGTAPLQQYIVETEPGRLQVLDVAWDNDRKRWYHLYPDQDLPPDNGLHWSGPYKNWNARCAECHATGYRKNYNAQSKSYSSQQAEIGVGCEACHGPGAAHVDWAKTPDAYARKRPEGLTDHGFTIGFSADVAETEIQQCASCHARREPLSGNTPVPGTPFHDAYRLALLRDGLYHADGSIDDEVYVYGSFLQSKMYARGVRCSDCHDPHAAELKAYGNAVCTQCHAPAGNPRFPSLRKALYDTPAHFFHKPGTAGANCVDCHMISRVYMGIDGRRDHSFRVPRPDLSVKTGTPNACTDCHTDKDAAWAAAEISQRFPDSTQRGPHFSEVFTPARQSPAAQANALADIALNGQLAGIVRASALDLLRNVADPDIAARTAPLLADADPLLREAAVAVQRGAPPAVRVQRLVPLLDDKLRSVRIAVARQLLDAPIVHMPASAKTAMQRAMREWHASMRDKADFPETHIALGGVALVTRNFRAAEAAFRETVRLDPQQVDAWRMIVRIRAALGDTKGARAALAEALSANPSEEQLLKLRQQIVDGER